MIQRFLYTAIRNGLDNITADPKILEELFGDVYELPTTEVDAIKTLFSTTPPDVHHGYPRRDYEFPLYSIIMSAEDEGTHVMGDYVGYDDDPASPNYRADQMGSFWNHSYQVHCYAEHPDVTAYIYEVAKNILLGGESYFSSKGLFDIHVSGMDLAPDPRYIPEHLFVRQLGFKCQREFCRTDKDSLAHKAFSLDGVYIDRGNASSEDVGDVKTLVTVYVPGQEEG
jgi:hypothetical protein